MNKSNLKNRSLQQEQTIDMKAVQAVFELGFQAQIFMSLCQDTGQKPDLDNAKMFKESFNRVNSKKYPRVLNLQSMRLGVNTIMKLICILEQNNFKEVNIADNSISEYGMHSVKNLISTCKIESLNLSSNMISEMGLSLVLEELIRNTTIRVLDLGIEEGSIRKNSFGVDGARCLAAVLLQNKTLEVLSLQDNDIGINGAEIISIPLKRNKQLKELKIAQNMIKTQGAEYILQNALNLTALDLGKNYIKSSIGPHLKEYVEKNKNLRRVNLQFNDLGAEGIQPFFQSVVESEIQEINIRCNVITDRGLELMQNIFDTRDQSLLSLKVLNLANNEITIDGMAPLIGILNHLKLRTLNISKNFLEDDGLITLISNLSKSTAGECLEKIDVSACKICDKGFMHLLENVNGLPQLKYIKCIDNYISEKYEKVYIELLDKNLSVISLSLQGNRLSLAGIKGLKRIVQRNLKNYEQREPKKMNSEIQNLKEKQKKIKDAQEKIERQKREITRLEEAKTKLNDSLTRLERQEIDRKGEFDQLIRKKTEQFQKQIEVGSEKLQGLQRVKSEKEKSVQELNAELAKLRERRQQLEYQLVVTKNQGEMIEKEFDRKVKQIK